MINSSSPGSSNHYPAHTTSCSALWRSITAPPRDTFQKPILFHATISGAQKANDKIDLSGLTAALKSAPFNPCWPSLHENNELRPTFHACAGSSKHESGCSLFTVQRTPTLFTGPPTFTGETPSPGAPAPKPGATPTPGVPTPGVATLTVVRRATPAWLTGVAGRPTTACTSSIRFPSN